MRFKWPTIKLYLFLITAVVCVGKTNMEIYSSLEQLTDLVETNQQVIKHLRTFLDSHYEKLKKAEKLKLNSYYRCY